MFPIPPPPPPAPECVTSDSLTCCSVHHPAAIDPAAAVPSLSASQSPPAKFTFYLEFLRSLIVNDSSYSCLITSVLFWLFGCVTLNAVVMLLVLEYRN